jgi:hypothetical protein
MSGVIEMTDYFVKGSEGGLYKAVPSESLYPDNGTEFIPVGEYSELSWVRIAPLPTFRGKCLMRKKGKFGIWQTKYRYWTPKYFGFVPNGEEK